MAIFRREMGGISSRFTNRKELASALRASILRNCLVLAVFVLCVLAIFAATVPVVSADTQGCYIYGGGSADLVCQSNVLESAAEADCAENSDCSFSAMFFPGQACTAFDECEQVLCSVDCDFHSLTACEALGGRALDADEEELWCSEGCCTVGNFCEYVSLRYECVERALQQGLSEDDITMVTGSDVNPAYCQQNICGVDLSDGSLAGIVYNEAGEVLSDAELVLSSSLNTISLADGSYVFSYVPVGSYILRVSLDGYSSSSHSISIGSSEAKEFDIVLSELGEAYSISGSTLTEEGDILGSVALCYEGSDSGESGIVGSSSGCASSLSDGSYSISNILPGDYVFTLTKFGYVSTEVSVTINSDMNLDLVIDSIDFQGVSGYTWLDSNGNEVLDSGSEGTAYGVSIFVNGVLLGNSEYPEGDYSVYLEEGEYTISATYQDFASQEYEISVEVGETVDLDLLLTKVIGECSFGQENDQKPVAELSSSVVSGEELVVLSWDKPCPEVSGYILERNGEVVSESPSPLATSFTDYDVEWGQSYSYSIWAVYTDGPLGDDGEPQVRLSSSSADTSVTLGSSHCEGYEVGQQFCLFDDSDTSLNERKQVYSCDASNNLVVVNDCTSLDESGSGDYFCSEIGSGSGNALCKNAGECSVWSQGADPFGLYYDSEECYGEFSSQSGFENFCYYDTSSSIVNACYSCSEVTSCFDYDSEDACSVNNCLGQSCAWVEPSAANLDGFVTPRESSSELLDYSALYSISPDTGKGYCVPTEDIQIEAAGSDFCSLCGSDASLFENNYCMPEVCNNLGACYSDSDASECLSCGERATSVSNCYTYNSQLECSGGRNTVVSSGIVVGSQDQCSWNVCAWQGNQVGSSSVDSGSVIHSFFADTGYCFKDGNGDGIDDCASFTAGEYSACQVDVIPPQTSVVSESFEVVSLVHNEIAFLGEDSENPMGELGYCLAPADASACVDFEYVSYEGLLSSEEVSVDLTISSFLSGSVIDGESYLLRYFSLDKYDNRESVLETFVFIDTEIPSFDIEYIADTNADQSDLSVYLTNLNEPMACEFSLSSVLPSGGVSLASAARDADKEAVFSGLRGVIYSLEVNCVDDYGNVGSESLEIVFDLEQDITLIHPEFEGVVSETNIAFSVETAVAAVCTLYDTDSGLSLASFSADSEGKVHETVPISGFFEGVYAGEVQVVCEEQLTSDILEDYFVFEVDFTGPDTQIVLTEGSRIEEPSSFAWEEYFIEEVSVGFICESDGFDCVETYYCLGEGCEYAEADGYQQYVGDLVVDSSTEICYYSMDAGGLFGYPDCGEILIEGYGLVLVSPEEYTFAGEKWGISNTPVFDWAFTTKVDTGQCSFDFNEGFDLYSQPAYKTVPAVGDNYYVYSSFPGDVLSSYPDRGDVKSLYVTCEDYRGIVGPSTLMHLEYDPSAPVIESAYVDPEQVTEGIETFVFIETDDKTLCKFSDLTEGMGSREFDSMEFGFSGYLDNELSLSHSSDFEFHFVGASKEFLLAAQCMNGAGDFSETVELPFVVDYSVEGYIVSTSPSGRSLPGEYSLEVETSKNAICQLDGVNFDSTGGVYHTLALGALEEGEYQYAVNCRIGEVSREAEISFVLDASAPVILEVDDGSYSCSLDSVYFTPLSLDDDIASFSYELYKGSTSTTDDSLGDALGENFSEAPSSGLSLITSGSFPSGNTSLVNVSLEENASYFVRVSAQDIAGNIGQSVESDGFLAVDPDSEFCQVDDSQPTLAVNTGVSCSQVAVSLDCSDEIGCSEILYGQSGDSTSCDPSLVYYGGALSFTSSGYVCYIAIDRNGNNITGSELITFSDNDGDGVANSCDLCSGSSAGSAVNAEGCSYGEVKDSEQTDDRDSDGLPDTWEQLFDQTTCPFDYLSKDSDNNGITDDDDDYDGDGLANYEEYRNGYNPCLSDAPADDSVLDQDSQVDPVDPFDYSDVRGSSKRGFLGIVLLILGLLLGFGGIGGLWYYYTQSEEGKQIVSTALGKGSFGGSATSGQYELANQGAGLSRGPRGSSSSSGGVNSSQAQSKGMFSSLRDKVFGLTSVHEGRKKGKSRSGVFDEFTQETGHLGAFEDHIRSRGDSMKRLDAAVDTYAEHKEEIRSGLKDHEKSVFDRLDTLSEHKARVGSLEGAADKKDAQDIFKKLRKISDQRKE